MSEDQVLFKPTPKQEEFLAAVLSGKYRQLMYGGAVGGGKTYLLCALALMLCRIFPNSRWAIVRRDNGSLVHNLMPTFNQILPPGFLKAHNKTHKIMTFHNGSQIMFFAASPEHDPDLNRWRGLEVNGVFLDEANEVPREVYQKAVERSGRWNPPSMEVKPPPMVILTCNPATNWVKSEFYDKWKFNALGPRQFYLQATATDNPFIGDDTKEGWESLRESDPLWYERFILGNWDLHDEPNQLIKPIWVTEAFDRWSGEPIRSEGYLGVDVARFGDDKTVIAYRRNNQLVDLWSWDKTPGDFIVEKVIELMDKYNVNPYNVRIDTVGVGGPILDFLRARGRYVQSFKAGEKPRGYDRTVDFYSRRCEAWWNLRKMFQDGIIELNPKLRQHLLLIGDLQAPTYDYATDRKIRVESKAKIKDRMTRSPDYGDAVMQAFANSLDVQWIKDINKW